MLYMTFTDLPAQNICNIIAALKVENFSHSNLKIAMYTYSLCRS